MLGLLGPLLAALSLKELPSLSGEPATVDKGINNILDGSGTVTYNCDSIGIGGMAGYGNSRYRPPNGANN